MTRNYFSENEEIWDDLLYWLKNPITESEQKLRDEEYLHRRRHTHFSE